MHVVIMGCGRVGSTLAHSLESRGHSVAVIDQDADAFRRLGPDFAGHHGDRRGLRRRGAAQAGIERADAFAAVSSGDNSNIISARLARETFGVSRVAARIYDQRRAAGLRAARHPHRGDRPVDRRPDAAAPGAGGQRGDLPRPDEHRVDHRGAGAQGLDRPAAARAGGGDRRPGGLPEPVRDRHPAHRLHRRAGGRPGLHAGDRRHHRRSVTSVAAAPPERGH